MGKLRPLVDTHGYEPRYPHNVSRGYFATYLIEDGLPPGLRKERLQWINRLERHQLLLKLVRGTFGNEDTESEFHRLVQKHGLNFRRFFDAIAKHQFDAAWSKGDFDRLKLNELMRNFWNRPESNAVDPLMQSQAFQLLVDSYLFDIVTSSDRQRELTAWHMAMRKTRDCQLCGTPFSPIDTAQWIYFGSNGNKNVCFKCPVVARPTKKDLMSLLPDFVEACDFVPSATASPTNYAFMSRVPAEQQVPMLRAYGKMGTVDHAKKKFGSWFEAMAETGALPDGVLVTSRGVKCTAKDGHVCNSLDECLIDNWLHANQISHVKEPMYPPHEHLNPKSKRRADWQVGDVYIEYFGLIGDERYETKMREKVQLCLQFGLTLIELYPADLGHLDRKLGRLLLSASPANQLNRQKR